MTENDKTKKLPQIYAQPTVQNDRIISVLSSVLMRQLSARFVPAIRQRFPSSIPFSKRNDPLAIVFVKSGADKNAEAYSASSLLEASVKNTAIFSMSVVLRGPPWRDTQKLDHAFQLLDSNVRTVFVGSSGAMNCLVSYLSARQLERGVPLKGLCGVVGVFPETATPARGLPPSVPFLWIVDSMQRGRYAYTSMQNPNQITVVVPYTNLEEMKALFVARTVLKYVHIVSLIADETQLSMGKTPVEPMKPCQILSSRL